MFAYDPGDAVTVFPKGDYKTTIDAVTEKTSKKGNPMLEVKLSAWKGSARQFVNDYIVNPSTIYKLKQIAKALGKEDEFNAGKFDLVRYVGKSIVTTLAVDAQEGYDEKNVVKAYKPNDIAPTADDDVPF